MPRQDRVSDAYRAGTRLLCEGQLDEAARCLEEVPETERTADHVVALAKVYLELGRGAEALLPLEALARTPPEDPGDHAYLELLVAAALAAAGRPTDAPPHLDEAAVVDPRLERAALALARRIEDGRTPLVRL